METSYKENDNMVVKESMTNARDSFRKLKPSDPQDIHEVLIAISQRNLDQLHDTLMDRGTPGHPLYQQWLTFEQIGDLVRNEAALAAVESWLKSEAIEVTWRSPRGEYVKARARIEEWERVLSTRFYEWHDTAGKTSSVHHRSESYSVPSDVSSHISAIFNTCQVPPVITHHREMISDAWLSPPSTSLKASSTLCPTPPCEVNVAFLNSLYGITSNAGSTSLSQAVFETSGMNFSQVDLATFQTTYKLTQQKALVQPAGLAPSRACTDTTCGEGALDIQYIMGVAQSSKSIYWYVNNVGDVFFNFLTQVASTPNPPTSLSISWGTDESGVPPSFLKAFNTEAMKVTAMGITIFASSGDNGVSGNNCQCTVGTGYFPAYPVNCPYVVAVGATQGPEYGKPEVACQANAPGGVTSITSGGGFSTYYPRPSYQKAAVSAYLASTAGKAAGQGFNHTGRGYPDISFIGNLFPVYIAGAVGLFAGTSASAPVAAALITLVNTQRLARGLSTVGFIHPTLYANADKFTDITSGSNNCCAGTAPKCCTSSGFGAGPGWDPVTGLGSITYANLVGMFLPAPTPTPTSSPTLTYSPSSPSAAPSVFRNSSSTSAAGKSSAALSASAQAGIAFGVILGTLALAIAAWWWWSTRSRSSSRPAPKKAAPAELVMHQNPTHPSPPKMVLAAPLPPPPSQQSYAVNVSNSKIPPTPSSFPGGSRAASPPPPPPPRPQAASLSGVASTSPPSSAPPKPGKPPPKPQRSAKILEHKAQINSAFANNDDGDLW